MLVDPFITGFKRITAKKKSDSKINDTSIELNLKDGFQLHGCFLIFSPIYIKNIMEFTQKHFCIMKRIF